MSDHTGPRRFLGADQVDNVADAVLALTRELWVVADRQLILEAILARHGIDVAAEIDAFEPDPALQAALDTRRDRMVAAVSKALSGIDGG